MAFSHSISAIQNEFQEIHFSSQNVIKMKLLWADFESFTKHWLNIFELMFTKNRHVQSCADQTRREMCAHAHCFARALTLPHRRWWENMADPPPHPHNAGGNSLLASTRARIVNPVLGSIRIQRSLVN